MNALCNLELTSSGLLSEVILPTPSAESIVHNEPSQQQLAAIVEPGSTGVTSGDTERQQWAEDLAAAEKKVRLLEDKVKIFERDRKATDECMKEFDKLMKERNGELDLARQECKLHLDSATLSAKQLKSTQEDNRRLQDKMAAVNTRSKILRDKLRTVKKEKKLADERIKELEKFMEVFLF
ncbi:hypothetical protein HDE_08498 [Halotydeus destructor]|nr:hypothetical protein HDE_08498 [Halotydeus destructor]